MTRDRKIHAVTIVVLAGALVFVVAQRTEAPSRRDPTPQDAIHSMFNAAREGDVENYLAHYTEQMRASLQQPGLARYLKESNAAVKGIAISDVQPLTDREVKLRVEYVYQDRNEAQFMVLEKGPSGWKITRVDSAERVKTLVPYGTPVQ